MTYSVNIRLLLAASASMMLLCSCGDRDDAPHHPLLVKAARELDRNQPDMAARNLEHYLKLFPSSPNAHKQLATICDDHLKNPLKAIYHYRMYLESSPEPPPDKDAVNKWIENAEYKYYLALKDRFNDPEDLNTLRFKLNSVRDSVEKAEKSASASAAELRMANRKNSSLSTFLNEMKAAAQLDKANIAKLQRDIAVTSNKNAALSAELATLKLKLAQAETRKDSPVGAGQDQDEEEIPDVPHGLVSPTPKPAPQSGAQSVDAENNSDTTKIRVHTVRDGDTLMRISQQYYGSSRYYKLILDANKEVLQAPHLLMPGQLLKIPEREAKP